MSRTESVAELKRQRGYYAAYGQIEKVKAVDAELAKQRDKPSRKARSEREKPAAAIETATADTSTTETATARRRRPPRSSD